MGKSLIEKLCLGANFRGVKMFILTDKVIVLARLELKPSRLRRERSECNRKVHQLVRLIADGNYPWIRICNATCIVFFFRHLKHTTTLMWKQALTTFTFFSKTNKIYLIKLLNKKSSTPPFSCASGTRKQSSTTRSRNLWLFLSFPCRWFLLASTSFPAYYCFHNFPCIFLSFTNMSNLSRRLRSFSPSPFSLHPLIFYC